MPDTFHTLSCLCLQQSYERSPIIVLSQEAKIGGDYAIVWGQAAVWVKPGLESRLVWMEILYFTHSSLLSIMKSSRYYSKDIYILQNIIHENWQRNHSAAPGENTGVLLDSKLNAITVFNNNNKTHFLFNFDFISISVSLRTGDFLI